MGKRKSPDEFDLLRKRAEKLIAENGEKVTPISHQRDVRELSHELSVYHIELEMQNDEFRRSQEQLEESHERYRDLYEHAPVGFLTFDEKAFVLDMNLTAAHLLGIDRRFLLNKPFTALIAPESQDIFYFHRREVLRSGGMHICELMLRRSKGEERFFRAQLASSAARHDGTAAIRTVLTDITEYRKPEKENDAGSQRLGTKVDDRTAEIEALQRRLEEAEQTIEAIRNGEVDAVIVLILDDIVEPNGDRKAILNNVEQIIQASKRSRDLVKQILLFSTKSETHKRKPLKLSPLLKETAKLLRGTIPSTITIRLDVATDEDTILGDPAQFQQIVMNLASNAFHAMRNDGGTLTISLSSVTLNRGDPVPDTRPGRYLKLSIRDTGPGIPKHVRSRIFEPFFTTKEAGEGTGMGLAIVYGVVKGHGGAITVESKTGKGATFNVFLPAYDKKAEEETYGQDSLPGGKESVLLVDDEPLVIDMAARMLERLGYAVTTAGSAPEACDLFRKNPDRFDLVITDHAMPEMTGMTLAERMLEARRDTPVILLTGYGETVLPEKAKQAGVSEFLLKPVVMKELAEAVRRVLDRKTN